MKRIFILAAFAALLALPGCGKDDGVRHGTVDINVRETATKAGDVLSPKEIVKQCWAIEIDLANGQGGIRGWADAQRDTVNCKLKMWATDVINEETGKLLNDPENDFLGAKTARLILGLEDNYRVIAYIPSATLEAARTSIQAAYDKGDLDEVYRLFQEAYTAIPISQEDYDALKAEGKL